MRLATFIATLLVVLACSATTRAGTYDTGASDSEIKIGQTMPYSGPASSYSVQAQVEAAYFKSINEKGGIRGRKITLISLDDAYSPPKTVEQTRKLVEQEEVLFIYGDIGTATNKAVHKYLNSRQVPQILIQTGAAGWNEPKRFPWTMAFYPDYRFEASIYGKYTLETKPDAKVAILYQNEDAGRDFANGFKEGLGDKAKSMVVAELSYESTDPTIDSSIVTLRSSGADVLFMATTPKFGAQAIRKNYDIGWKPLSFIASVSSSIGAVLEPAGLDKSVGLISAVAFKTPSDPAWANDKDMLDYLAFMKTAGMENKISDSSAVYGYVSAILMTQILDRCGDVLSRANVMAQVASIPDETLPMLLPSITIKTTPEDFSPFKSLRLQRFDGKSWVVFGDPIRP
jgi:branched-chain amino acid transport system substrate-binding protein